MQVIKTYLVKRGPRSTTVRLALKLHSRMNGFLIRFLDEAITIRRGSREMILAERDFYLVPFNLGRFDQTFEEIEPSSNGTSSVLDFSMPHLHRYRRHCLTLSFPGAPEDDSIAAYTYWYKPKLGDLVFDMGAHAGFTTIMFARMVGPTGRVVAFEPDPASLDYLKRNLLAQEVSNVTIVPKAIDAKTGTAYFNADGTMSAGLVCHSIYGCTGERIQVQTISLDDVFAEFGAPQFIKMDIEGAEIGVIQSAASLLRTHPANLAFDTYHRMPDGRFTWMVLEPILRDIGYDVYSSAEFGQMFTWSRPPAATEK